MGENEAAPPRRPGVLLVNLGTPEAPRPGPVRRYLREFLSDPRVIDLPAIGRWLLLNLIILPFRPARSAAAYRAVWMPEGSPLLVYSRAFAKKIAARLAGVAEVELAMRYGKPSIAEGLERLRERGASELVVFPLYPLNAASTFSTTVERVFEEVAKGWEVPPITTVPAFFDRPGFLAAFEANTREIVERTRADHVLFSFHGLPERHMLKSDPTGRHCLASASCCDAIVNANRGCYRAQSFFVARALAQRLELEPSRYSVAFQSRLGRTPWIKPYTDVLLVELAARGVKRLAVVCPSFVADCLETLEEISIRAKETFVAAGGEELVLVPSLNDGEAWVSEAAALIQEAL